VGEGRDGGQLRQGGAPAASVPHPFTGAVWNNLIYWGLDSENSEPESCTDRHSSLFKNNYFVEM